MTSVYVMESSDGPIKIGISAAVEKRRQSVRPHSGSGNIAVRHVHATTRARDVERLAHYLLREKCLGQEWFDVGVDEGVQTIRAAERMVETMGIEAAIDHVAGPVLPPSITDRGMTVTELRAYVQSECDRLGSAALFIRKTGGKVSPSVVSSFLQGRINPPPALLRAMGLQKVYRFVLKPKARGRKK